MRLSVLDQSPIRDGGTATQAIRETIELARAADRLGYARYWLAEHHNSGGLASATPEVLIGAVAAETERIRVGSGGVMLTHYSPLKVAESFRMLEALHPGRIDLGVGRAPGSDRLTAAALTHRLARPDIDHYSDQLMELYGYLSNSLPEDHAFANVRAMPSVDTMPELWVLGSSLASAQYAAELGWSFCFAHFINQHAGVEAMRLYRERFDQSPFLAEPRASLALSVTCAETTEEAERLSWSRWVWRMAAGRGGFRGIPTPEDAQAFPLTEPERDYIEFAKANSIYGDARRVREKIEAMAEEFGVEEAVIVTITHDFRARVRSYELLAEAFGLQRD
ncbi:MAG: LLM class flavin-dependent oxidoreductase [Tepidiformaceae bacterium]